MLIFMQLFVCLNPTLTTGWLMATREVIVGRGCVVPNPLKKELLPLDGMLSRDEALARGSTTKLSFVGKKMANYYLEKISVKIDTESILAACDMTRVSQCGNGKIYKIIKGRVGIVDKDMKVNFLPTPNKVC